MKNWYMKLGFETRILAMTGALALVPTFGYFLLPSSAPPPSPERATDVTTFIPKGFVLVPIEVENYEALDSILGRFGTVDLLRPAREPGASPNLVARNVRLLRAPQNPIHFAVLIAENEVDRMLAEGSLFTVIVKRAQAGGTEFVKTKKGRKIIYDGG
ncbi:MAG TPA: hypothetical protein PKC28_05770 [Bdellovibrionales bacterium]|nr:hypothetical protein [Bdellovibrionales bacterium]